MRSEDVADQSSLPTKFRLSFSTGAMKHPPDGFIAVLRDRQLLGGFLSILSIGDRDGSIWPILIKIRQEIACLSAQG